MCPAWVFVLHKLSVYTLPWLSNHKSPVENRPQERCVPSRECYSVPTCPLSIDVFLNDWIFFMWRKNIKNIWMWIRWLNGWRSLLCKPVALSLIPGPHEKMEKDNWCHTALLWPPHMRRAQSHMYQILTRIIMITFLKDLSGPPNLAHKPVIIIMS